MSDHKELKNLRKQMRTLVADYMYSEGCMCCQDIEAHKENEARLGKLLNVPKYSDGSGYDFGRYRSENK